MISTESGDPSPIQQQLDKATAAHQANTDAFLEGISKPLVGSSDYAGPDAVWKDKLELDARLPATVATDTWSRGLVIQNEPSYAAELRAKGAVTAAQRRALLEAQQQSETTPTRLAHVPLSHIVRIRPS